MDILEQIFDKGYATTKVDVAQGKVKAEIKNLTLENMDEVTTNNFNKLFSIK